MRYSPSFNPIAGTLTIVVSLFLTGCASDATAKKELDEGYSALDEHQYDSAMAHADAFLEKTPTGNGSAEALYLRGRAYEQKTAANPAQSQANLKAAREAYVEALTRSPSPKLEAYIRTSLANVAYFQDDYVTAATEWTTAYDKLEDKEVKAWVLYRVGICRQRLGQFADADKIFKMVQEQYPDTTPAQRAKEHEGVRTFAVQFATFNAAAKADAAAASLRSSGVAVNKQTDSQGRSVIMSGPMPSFQQAQSVRTRFAGTYPDALILP
jgi:outer membrane protein assembly factor BamD (BamD/ComL family)